MPPRALISSIAMRMALALLTPWTAVTPDRSVMVPTMISVSLTPRVGAVAARPMTDGANRAPAVPANTDRRAIARVFSMMEASCIRARFDAGHVVFSTCVGPPDGNPP